MQLKTWIKALACMWLVFGFKPVSAEVFTQTMPSGLGVNADYLPGENELPLVLLLHGLLQTHEFTLIRKLADNLSISGYPVLIPTLSLGVNLRTQSLACTVVHQHRIEDEVEEIAFWLDWAEKRGHSRIILAAHSAGNVTELAYLEKYPADPRVTGMILISPMSYAYSKDAGQNAAMAAFAEQAEQAVADGKPPRPVDYTLSYCKKYPTLPASYLSYYRWNAARVSGVLQGLKIPLWIIIGQRDDWVPTDWIEQMQGFGKLKIIQGANHFFSGAHEDILFVTVDGAMAELAATN